MQAKIHAHDYVEFARLQHHVAGALGRPAGRLLMMVKSAHVHQAEFEYVHGVLAEAGRDR